MFDTIYIGGGTPSLLEPVEVGAIIEGLSAQFRFERPVEVTLEANPGTVDEEKLSGFRSAGVNRLNIGGQSFQEKDLRLLGTVHSARQAREAPDYREQLEKELAVIHDSEMWQAGAAVRSLRPENWRK